MARKQEYRQVDAGRRATRSTRLAAAATVALAAAALQGCGKGDSSPGPAASSGSAQALPASASATGTSSTPKAAKKAPPAWAPALWEAAYAMAKGREPPRPIVEEAAPELIPACANRSGRVYLREKYQDEYAKQVVATEKENTERRKTADADWLPKQQEWLKSATVLASVFKGGVFPSKVPDATSLSQYGPLGSKGSLQKRAFDEGVGVDAFREALTKLPGWDAPFRCRILGAKRTQQPASPRTKAALQAQKAAGGPVVPVDQITCEEISGAPLRIVVEVPAFLGIAKISVAGTDATIESYELAERPGLDPKIAAALDGGDTWTLAGAVIEVSGVSRLARADHGALAFAMLKDRGMEMQFAIKSAENKNVWVANFDKACGDEGLGCTYGDGRAAPAVKYISDSVSKDPKPEPSASADESFELPAESEGFGRWERAARAADPSIAQDPSSYHDEPWAAGFFPALVQSAQRPDSYGAPGIAVNLSAPPSETNPVLSKFRAALADAGGMGTFTCTVQDMGEEINSLPIPVVDAALKAKGETLNGAWSWNVVCKGDAKSHVGTVVLYVPSYLAWAQVEQGKIRDYHLERYGYFAPELREIMLDVGKGTVLEVSGAARLLRTETKYVVLGQEWSTPVWRAYLYDWQCPADGVGCKLLDGQTPPMIKPAAGGLKKCDVMNRIYPPPK